MQSFNNNKSSIQNKPDFLRKPDLLKKSDSLKKPGNPQDKSIFKGRSEISRYEIKRLLEKDTTIRNDLAKKLQLRPWSPEMDAEIKKMQERIPERFGGFLDKNELKKAIVEEYWNAKHDINEKMKEGITVQESKEVARRKEEAEFLKKKFGI